MAHRLTKFAMQHVKNGKCKWPNANIWTQFTSPWILSVKRFNDFMRYRQVYYIDESRRAKSNSSKLNRCTDAFVAIVCARVWVSERMCMCVHTWMFVMLFVLLYVLDQRSIRCDACRNKGKAKPNGCHLLSKIAKSHPDRNRQRQQPTFSQITQLKHIRHPCSTFKPYTRNKALMEIVLLLQATASYTHTHT